MRIDSAIAYSEAVEHIAHQEIEELKVICSLNGLNAAIGENKAKALQMNVRNAFEAKANQRIEAIANLFGETVDELTVDVRRKRREMTGEVEMKD